jgi:hypothetical protein
MTNRKSAALSIFHKQSAAACRKYQKTAAPVLIKARAAVLIYLPAY